MKQSKNTITLTESELEKVIQESVKKVLKEDYDSNPLYRYYNKVIDSCGSIIFQNQAKGRRFVSGELGPLQEDQQFMAFRQELLENMEAYFNSTKQLLSYVAKKCQEDGETRLVDAARRWINAPFTPEW
jgi:hypothetical protein